MGSMGDSSSEVSAIVRSDREAMLMDGDRVMVVSGTVSASGAGADSGGGD